MKNHERVNKTDQSGVVLIVCMIILLMLSLIGIASISNSNSDLTIAGNELNQTGSFYAAESGLEQAASEMKASYESSGVPPDPLPHGEVVLNNHHFTYNVTDDGPAVIDTLDFGSYSGLLALTKEFNIDAVGYDPEFAIAIQLEMGYMDALVPIFQFAAFYENDLEIANLPPMLLNGRVHTNSDLYVSSWSGLTLDSYLTSAGNLLHGVKDGSGLSTPNGDVLIMDGNGVYQNMRNLDGTFLDSRDPGWVNESLARWGGNVEDGNHGITELNMPIVMDGPPTDIIDRGDGNPDSFEHDAGLKFVDDQALYLQGDGTWLDVMTGLVASGAITYADFRDSREGRNVQAMDLDLGLLANSGYYPTNGIIYSSTPDLGGDLPAIRLINGQQIQGPLTVATDNPLYTVGDFNTINKQPASFLADAVTVLSSNWDDTRSGQSLNNRQPVATRVNASFITGNTETGAPGHDFNGGFNNLLRFLEDWNENIEFTWRGSASCLWYSRQADSPWSYNRYYTAPLRNWAFDTDLLDPNNLPPGTPRINLIQRTSWSHRIINEYHSPY